MEFIKGITFASFARKGLLASEEAHRSLDNLVERTNANLIIIVPFGLQETAHSEKIEYDMTCGDDELAEFIDYAHKKGLMVALKPTVNCRNGTWRAHINFFDEDVPCEPKWGNWFASYTKFQMHFAKLAKQANCEMFIAGCEMVQTERREGSRRFL